MSFWGVMNWVAYGASALIFAWLIKDFLYIERNYDEAVLLGLNEPDEEIESIMQEGG